ncbi:MAG: bifunctional metallophosphatase/5'-nucleotidase [Verrucomicrobiales bacterium]
MSPAPIFWTRRRLLGGIAGTLVAPSLFAGKAPAPGLKTISIIHTTDLHGHILPTENYDGVGDLGGFARCSTQIARWRQECPANLLVDLGDVYQGTPESLANRGQLMMRMFNHLNYDAWVIGNHDLDWGRSALEANLATSRSPVLTANLLVDGKEPATMPAPWEKVKPWILREIDGLKIAFIGLTTPGMPMWLAPETLGGIEANDPIARLKSLLPELRAAKPNAIVVLGHMGWKFQDDNDNPVRELLEAEDGIDVYLGGHSHQDQPSWKWKGVQCSQAGYYGIWCGRCDLHFHEESGKLYQARAITMLMDERIPADPEVLKIAAEDVEKARAEEKRVLREIPEAIDGKGRESGLNRMFADAFSDALNNRSIKVDGVFHGTFGSGEIPAGPITVGDVWRIIPYENLLSTALLTADDLLAIVAEEKTISRSDRKLSGFDIIEKDGISTLIHQGTPVNDRTRRFTIAFNSYDGQSGGGRLNKLKRRIYEPAAKRSVTDIETREALITWLGKK